MSKRFNEDKELYCSFCGKSQEDVLRLVAGNGVYICEQCIAIFYDMLVESGDILDLDSLENLKDGNLTPEMEATLMKLKEMSMLDNKREGLLHNGEDLSNGSHKDGFKLLSPKEIFEKLNDYVIGQDLPKKTLAVAVYNHYKRIQSSLDEQDDVMIQKSNILMLGPTGSGKTLLAQTLAKILDVPFALADATALTEAGYVGEDVENILLKLIQAADYDIEKAQRGIIYVDEIDKISRKGDNPSITRDVSGEGVQQALLKIVEGTVANVPPQGGRKHPMQEFLQFDTSNVLFICGGAFDGMADIIKRRLGDKVIGFNSKSNRKQVDDKDLLSNIEPEDLIKYGLIPEFIGRLPVTVSLDEMTEETLIRIMKEPKNAIIKQYKLLFQMDGVELDMDDDAIEAIAKQAIERNTGARGLRSIFEKVMMDTMFEIPSRDDIKKCTITKECVTEGATPKLTLKRGRRKNDK